MPVAEVHVNRLAESVDVVSPRHATAQSQIEVLTPGRTKPSFSRDGCARNHSAPAVHVGTNLHVKKMISRGLRLHLAPAMPVSKWMEIPAHKERPGIQSDIEHSQANQQQE